MCVLKCLFKILFAVFILQSAILGADGVCDKSQAKPTTLRLKEKLMCGYDRETKPVKDSSNTTINVTVHMRVMFINFVEDQNALDVHSWTRYQWKDEFLTWDKADYDDISYLQIPPTLIWLPDVSLHNPSDISASYLSIADRRCWLSNEGLVTCVIPTVHAIECGVDIKLWPFDWHNCTMRVGSWTSYSDQINISLQDSGVSFFESHGYNAVGDWTLLNATAVLKAYEFYNSTKTSPFLKYSFVLKRNSGIFAATVIVPSMVMAVMALVIFWLDSASPERITIMCLNVLCHCLYMMYLEANLPHNGDMPPVILLLFRDSLLMVSVSLIITLVVRRCALTTSTPPSWLVLVVNGALYTSPGQILFLGAADNKMTAKSCHTGDSDQDELMETSTKINPWYLFGIILDRLAFILFLITYIVLITAFVPEENF